MPESKKIWEMDVFIDVEGHSPIPPRKFRPADTLERAETIVQETLAIPLLDQELWCNGKVVGNVPIVKDIQSLAEAGIKRRGYRACQHGMECGRGIDPIAIS